MYALRPGVVVEIAGRSLTSFEAGLARVVVKRGPSGHHDSAVILLWRDSELASPAPGDPLSIELGEEDDESLVFTGHVARIASAHDGVRIEALSSTAALARERTSATFQSQTVADVVSELAGDAAVGTVDGTTKLESYAVDDRRTVWSHLVELARLAGAEIGSDAEGALTFRPPAEGPIADVTLRYGADLIAWDVSSADATVPRSPAAYGSASEAGEEKWHWIQRTPSGSGDGDLWIVPGFHNKDAADALSEALAAGAERGALSGRLLTFGRPDVTPGSLVDVEDAPGVASSLRVTALEHRVDGASGFVTELVVEGAAGGGLL